MVSKHFLHGHICKGSAEKNTDLFLLIIICVMSRVSCKKWLVISGEKRFLEKREFGNEWKNK